MLFKKKKGTYNNKKLLDFPSQTVYLKKFVDNVKIPDYDKEYKNNYKRIYKGFNDNSDKYVKWRTTMAKNCPYITNTDQFMYANIVSQVLSPINDVICSMVSYLSKHYHVSGYCFDVDWQEFDKMIYKSYDEDESILDIGMKIWDYLHLIFDDFLAWQNKLESSENTAKYAYMHVKKLIVPCIESLKKMSPLSQKERIAVEEHACHRKDILLYADYVKKCFQDYNTAIEYIKKIYENRAVMGFVAYEWAIDKNWINRPSAVLTPGWNW